MHLRGGRVVLGAVGVVVGLEALLHVGLGVAVRIAPVVAAAGGHRVVRWRNEVVLAERAELVVVVPRHRLDGHACNTG